MTLSPLSTSLAFLVSFNFVYYAFVDVQVAVSRIGKAVEVEQYVDPGLDPAIDEELKEYIRLRKEEVPDADFF